ncbi:MAG: AtpZ/AtpI family protein [Polyangiales bacterium]
MSSKYRDLGDVGAVGIEFVLAMMVGYYAGHWLDGKFFGGHGYMTGFGCVVGVGAAFKAIFDAGKRANRRLEELEKSEKAERAKRAAPSIDELRDATDQRLAEIERRERGDDDRSDDDR